MDAATKSLNHIVNSGEYRVFKNIPVFDTHEEFDADGNPVRKFTKQDLQKIVDECNRRAEETGDLSPFGPGHTISDAPEYLQPVTYGYAKNYRVGEFGPKKKTGILVDFHVKKKVTRPDGKAADGVAEFKSYPRRSIELWLKDGFIDHIALLRRAPQRDLGLVAFDKEQGETFTVPSTGNLYRSAKKDYSYAAAVRGNKLCYAMEPDMPMPMGPAMGAPGPDSAAIPGAGGDPEYQKFSQMMDQYIQEKFGDNLSQFMNNAPDEDNALAETDPGLDDAGDTDEGVGDMPPAPPTSNPVAKPEDDVVKMARQFASADPKVQMASYQRLLTRLAQVEQGSREQAKQYSRDDAINRVATLVGMGVILDSNEEQKEFEKRPMGKVRDAYQAKIEKHYQRDAFSAARPVRNADFLNTGPSTNGVRRHSREQIDKIVAETAGDPVAYARRISELDAK